MLHMVELKNHQVSGTVELGALTGYKKNAHGIIFVVEAQQDLVKNA